MKKSDWYSPELLAQWFATARGEQLINAEFNLLEKSISRLFGAHCGLSSAYTHPQLIERIPCRRVYDILPPSLQLLPARTSDAKPIVAPICNLPFADDSLDGFVLLHTFDFAEKPHDAIREVARVIRPGGQIIIIGFNPASLFGWCRYMPGLKDKLPAQAHFIGRHRLCDWLNLLHFDVEYFGGASLMPFRRAQPVEENTRQQMAQSSVWKAARIGMGKAFRERYGGVYCLRVRKSHLSGTLVGAEVHAKRALWQPLVGSAAVSRIRTDAPRKPNTD